MTPRISLLHATYHRENGPLEVKERWLEAAHQPDRVDYILAMDGDDLESIRATEGHRRIVGASEAGVTAVRNWNNAALLATGDLLVVIADDLMPSDGWDLRLCEVVKHLDPLKTPFAVKVRDSEQNTGVILRHPAISRAFYDKHGLFNSKYRGVYCDDDITLRAFWRTGILDGRSVRFVHEHPLIDEAVQASASQTKINTDVEYEHGRKIFEAEWSERERAASVRLISPQDVAGRGDLKLRFAAERWRLRAHMVYIVKSIRPASASLTSALRRYRSRP